MNVLPMIEFGFREGVSYSAWLLGRAVSLGVLVLAGIKLIFFLVAGIVLCFGFRIRIVLITH